MLEEPALNHGEIVRCLHDEYALNVGEVAFLPLGADQNTAVYRVRGGHAGAYFLKLRSGIFDPASVTVPKYLSDQGMQEVIPPIATGAGQLSANLPPFRAILYPYVKGHNAIERKLSERQWIQFGAALKRFHSANIPPEITRGTPREDFSPQWRDAAKSWLQAIQRKPSQDPIAAAMAAFLDVKRSEVLRLVERADQLAHTVQHQPHEVILCHGDIHGWNLLVDESGRLFVVDWDTLVYAPKERDLMFIGGGNGTTGYPPDEEARLFYQGYGPVSVDYPAIAYYRYERIIEDIALYCEQIFSSAEGAQDRKQALQNVKSNFLLGETIEMARRADQSSGSFSMPAPQSPRPP